MFYPDAKYLPYFFFEKVTFILWKFPKWAAVQRDFKKWGDGTDPIKRNLNSLECKSKLRLVFLVNFNWAVPTFYWGGRWVQNPAFFRRYPWTASLLRNVWKYLILYPQHENRTGKVEYLHLCCRSCDCEGYFIFGILFCTWEMSNK